MATAFQKIAVSTALLLGCSFSPWAQAQNLNECGNGPLMVGQKQVGMASYFAQNCSQSWQEQTIQMDFAYTQNIPEWAFKRAATHLLKRNVKDPNIQVIFKPISDLYRPVRSGDLYRLKYSHVTQTLSLSLNRKNLGQLQHPLAQQYFNIWLGPQPFSAKLKQQLLN
ncbi:chalcone isomerase family protein [Acinetobacter sp. C_4_1]|uniref:chalcone isomerase family protein n=1 Tax=unclassified Acinetobacter TaxID=196816 RepID=UPI0021B71E27|nr:MULTISPECIES: chalcone isomerase family protein [unclassified Acinetobacter]MCT8088235.1 chalcone isomerase family protein [Acinetobacter sp. F_3_1]MCT8097604.1 chalcone isomerase family protein [Acinetobacter sp. C_3_1]MCT8100697.1 chalcone isomerase family protein [Acinetobacter sp. C_4_1]MCT8134016.1 chalcone isomerase family protein [Acinetobacter sp. T_3_1]